MAFDLYFAGIQALELDEYLSSKDCHRLFSYADKPKKRLQMFNDCQSKIFMDSGAFGVAHSGKQITLDDYIEFINDTPRVTLFACLDVIPWPELTTQTAIDSAEQSWKNYCYMVDNVKPEYKDKIVPVYHYGEDFKYLERMLEGYNGYKAPYIAFGGRGGVHTRHLHPSLDKFFEIIKQKRPDVKTHAFGITVLKVLEKYPFTSADSTSYLQTAVNGSIYLECLGKVIKISNQTAKDPTHYNHRSLEMQQVINNEITKYGYTVAELQESFRSRFKFNIDYFIRWQKNYQYKEVKQVKRRKLF